jgi:glycosyltransferase involved in cell wall biosynthesis
MAGVDISIIIPTYNRLWCLPDAIESCRNNKYAVEIIVVDDGSTDGTWEWLQKQKDIVILQQQHWGKCWAVNKAFDQANGEYIRFLDSDDKLAPGANDEQYRLAADSASDIVVSGYLLTGENNQILKKQPWVECDDFIAQQLGECDSSHYSAYLFRKSFIEDIPHRPDYAYRDDRLFVIEAALKHPKVSVHPGFALIHTEHKSSRLQRNSGMQQTVQNFQHLNIYKNVLGQLKQKGELTPRRIKASINALWPLCKWIAKDNINEADNLLKLITSLDPAFKIKEEGTLGLLYKTTGANTTHKILRLFRFFKYKHLN